MLYDGVICGKNNCTLNVHFYKSGFECQTCTFDYKCSKWDTWILSYHIYLCWCMFSTIPTMWYYTKGLARHGIMDGVYCWYNRDFCARVHTHCLIWSPFQRGPTWRVRWQGLATLFRFSTKRCWSNEAKVSPQLETQLRGWKSEVSYKNRGFT
jgi:hypothetical protein